MNKNWSVANDVVKMLEFAGFEAVIVGGAVRDYILGRPFHDVDVATNALPEQVKQVFKKTFDVGIEHGTILVADFHEPVEVTTYRAESEYVDYRRPEQVKFVLSLEEDLKRRDFTMNAMAMNQQGELIDLYEGKIDIERKQIRAVGDPYERFQEDALRMLRAIRFQAQLGFTIECKTFDAMKQLGHLIQHISIERIQMELTKSFLGPHVKEAMHAIQQTNMQHYLIGQFNPLHWENKVFHNEEDAWAYFYVVNDQDDLLTKYKSSNKRKAYGKTVKALVTKTEWDLLTYFEHDEKTLLFANEICNRDTSEAIQEKKRQLPIQAVQDLAVSGKEIVEWSQQNKGPWVKERLNALIYAVLTKEVANNPSSIKEWYDAAYNEG